FERERAAIYLAVPAIEKIFGAAAKDPRGEVQTKRRRGAHLERNCVERKRRADCGGNWHSFLCTFLHLISSIVLKSSANAVMSDQWPGKAEADPSHRSATAGDPSCVRAGRVRDDKVLGWCPKNEHSHPSQESLPSCVRVNRMGHPERQSRKQKAEDEKPDLSQAPLRACVRAGRVKQDGARGQAKRKHGAS